jgi:hypothetical protein
MTTTPEQIEAVARAIANDDDWCGAKFNGEFCLCDDPRLDDDVRSPECFCRLQASAAINAMRPFIRAEALEEAEDVVGEVGDCAEAGAYINAIRALKEKP